MRKYCIVIFLMLFYLGTVFIYGSTTKADAILAKELIITQIKITGDEFVVLHNATTSNLNIGNFWLQYYNEFNLSTSGVSNSSQQLPAVILQPNQEILLSTGSAANCGQVWVSKLSFSLKDSAGLLQLVSLSQSSGLVSLKSQDQVSWSSKTTDPVDLKGISTSATQQIWYKNANSWQSLASPFGCSAIGTATSSSTNTPSTLTRLNSSPPSIVLGATSSEPDLSAANAGLSAPQISELLPNPASPQTDATDEFIELYNPNNAPFDLSGFILRTGTTTFHNYTFPSGQFIMQPHEFRAFYAPQTGIALSNSTGQAALLDPQGNVLAETDIYDTAKDGYAWIYAQGLWQWTTASTPNIQNTISVPIIVSSTSSKAKTLAAAKSKKATTKKAKALSTTAYSPTAAFNGTPSQPSSLHPLMLAGVGLLALLYACYEYRHDIANQIYRFRRNRKTGGTIRQAA